MNDFLQKRIQNMISGSDRMMNAYPEDLSVVEQDRLRDRINQDPQFAAQYRESTDYAQPQSGGTMSDQERQMIMQNIMEMQSQIDSETDPTARMQLGHLQEALEVGMDAPYSRQAVELTQQGRGEDSAMAHLRPGEVILPPEALEDPQFEQTVQAKFEELGIDPMEAVVGVGIASLNPNTGLEEFGFFKKIGKSIGKVVKKVVKPVAQVAQFIPGPWQPFAIAANKAFTVYDVATGKVNPLALATLAMGPKVGGSAAGSAASGGGFLDSISKGIGSIGEYVTAGADGVGLLGNLGKGIGSIGTNLSQGLGNVGEYVFAGKDGVNLLGNLGNAAGNVGEYVFSGQDGSNLLDNVGRDVFGYGVTPDDRLADVLTKVDATTGRQIQDMMGAGMSSSDILAQMGAQGPGLLNQIGGAMNAMQGGMQPAGYQQGYQMQSGYSDDALTSLYANASPQMQAQMAAAIQTGQFTPQQIFANFGGGQQGGQQGYQNVNRSLLSSLNKELNPFVHGNRFDAAFNTPNFIKDIGNSLGFGGSNPTPNVIKSLTQIGGGGSGGVGGSGIGLGGLGIAGLLGKMAYDNAKDAKGVPLTPLTQMSPAGRYNIEAEVARRMGNSRPDPVEFGLLPEGTFPTLSGGRPEVERKMQYGGPVMAYAEGGNVDSQEFKKMDGKIAGEGTETSDDIPAMLSDGEYVMTARAVRGAGAYEMKKKGGIITLEKGSKESRDDGTSLMYDLMSIFEKGARASA
tara:strand:+ start:770 stop:2989 length:2220 start_codon:yes stop_codon:yes gene_type:complete